MSRQGQSGFSQWAALLALALSFSSLLVVASTPAAGNEGCGPECRGECFAGRCLFVPTDDFEDALPTFSPVSAQSARLSVLEKNLQQDSRIESPLQPQLERLQPDANTAQAAFYTVPTSPQMHGAAQPSQHLGLGLNEDPQRQVFEVLARPAAALTHDHWGVSPARQDEVMLRAENNALKDQLIRWREAGSKVVQREARVVDLIKQAHVTPPTALASTAPASPHTQPQPQLSLAETGSRLLLMPTNATVDFMKRGLMTIVALSVLLAIWWATCGCTGMKEPVDHNSCGRSQMYKPSIRPNMTESLLRKMGLSHYVLEISEIQVSNLLPNKEAGDGDICVSLQMGSGREMRTRAMEFCDGLMRFQDAFAVDIRKGDGAGKCVLRVLDREPCVEERLAYLEVPGKELLEMVHQQHGEYFSFELTVQAKQLNASRRRGGEAQENCSNPQVAMRIRDISGVTKQQQKLGSSRALQPRSEQTYGSVRDLESVA